MQRAGQAVKRAGAHHGIKVGIVMLGAAVAVGTVNRTTYLPHTTLVAKLAEARPSAPIGVTAVAAGTTTVAATPTSSAAPGGLDAGVDHARIDYWVNRLSSSPGVGFGKVLTRMTKYADMITAKLAAKDMPRDLIYLAAIESEFNPSARSRVQAVGLWQFMSSTARRFGLTVRKGVDERKDPARATDAALDYLSALHDRFGSWYLAAAAYNSGEGTVLRALRSVTGKSTGTDEDFFKILPALPKETQDYVPKLIAAARVGNAPERYGVTVSEVAAGDVSVPTRHPAPSRARTATLASFKTPGASRAAGSRHATRTVEKSARKATKSKAKTTKSKATKSKTTRSSAKVSARKASKRARHHRR